ncbi:MAG: glucose-1-phosphate thymidylyltransferase RfbA [Lachnospiraceae bacterium]
MKGIILAGGTGSRLFPMTLVTSKQLLPVYDKPMIYYPMSTLIEAGIREILIISTPEDLPNFRRLFGSGESLGLSLSYMVQEHPDGLAQAFLLGKEFIGGEPCAMILGDNLFYGKELAGLLKTAAKKKTGATIFAAYTETPERLGVIEFDEQHRAVSIEEKPKKPKSNYCVTGLYFYDGRAPRFASELKPSARGELEITDLNNRYLSLGELEVVCLKQETVWMDMGTVDSLWTAAEFVKETQEKTGTYIGMLEEAAYRQDFLSKEELAAYAAQYQATAYGAYLKQLNSEAGKA